MYKVFLVLGLLSGCCIPAPPTTVGTHGAVLYLDASFLQWRDGSAVPLFNQAAQWWRDAGAEVQIAGWGYPVTLTHGAGWGPDMIGYGGPVQGIQLDQTLLDEVAAQPNGSAWLLDTFAHELGHVLRCSHISDPASVMHAVIHPDDSGLTPQDVDELARVGG